MGWLVSFVILGIFYCIRFYCIIIVLLVHILITLKRTLTQTLNSFNGIVHLIIIRPFRRRKVILSRIILTKNSPFGMYNERYFLPYRINIYL